MTRKPPATTDRVGVNGVDSRPHPRLRASGARPERAQGAVGWLILAVLAIPLGSLVAGFVDAILVAAGLLPHPLMMHFGLGRHETSLAWAAIAFVGEVLAVRRWAG